MSRSLKYCLLPALLSCVLAHAQTHAPLTGGAAVSAPAAAPSAEPAAAPAVVRQVDVPTPPAPPAQTAFVEENPGDVTRALMAAQADGRRAGPGLRLQGPVATAAWRRYLKSFEHPLPPWFASSATSGKGGSGGGLGMSQ
ncbi:Protein of uncharacterised function (DUF3613) [Bordetella hinzii]|uniref:DUF3613 domain-containing protein n=1 Tax=Bordetella hinzii TaxID=103855 RepID=UPI0004043F75|nr:DUF3613 domain-containing protein [Bordetella hinzii]AKQ56848.1 hypothetical protein ACR54_03558 [Bordetella hinzii]KCB24114.1 PF12266 family protein [Bordetella hinzii L60]SNV68991.1 Protein of uncharacterised function (DUF3613) [Bordetella hinzii]